MGTTTGKADHRSPVDHAGPIRVTVLTATYNRCNTLPRLYDSLVRQNCSCFEWLVIDDGSTDNTRDLIAQWQAESPAFPIRYHWKPNGGKHTAHNCGVALARGEYCAIIDSDDWYAPAALGTLLEHWDALPAETVRGLANIDGLCCFEDGTVIGSPFPEDVFDSDLFSCQYQRARPGDCLGMHRTGVLREFPFPEAADLRFVTESLVWNRVAASYRSRFLNRVIGYKEYLPGGLSHQSRVAQIHSSRASLLYHAELLQMQRRVPLSALLRSAANYTRLSLHQQTGVRRLLRDAPRKPIVALALPVGLLLYLGDRIRRSAGHSMVTQSLQHRKLRPESD